LKVTRVRVMRGVRRRPWTVEDGSRRAPLQLGHYGKATVVAAEDGVVGRQGWGEASEKS
jgi:hypothetical protein